MRYCHKRRNGQMPIMIVASPVPFITDIARLLVGDSRLPIHDD